jgi:arabinan endo-1,5-alpha-L-arabinosidase
MKLNHHALPSLNARSITLLTGSVRIWAVLALLAPLAFALDGQVQIHDPTTVMTCNGKYHVFGTGSGTLVSDDGWTWRRGANVPGGGGMGPDIIHVGDRYYMYVASNTAGGQPHSQIRMTSTKSLDPESPDYGWEDGGIVNRTDGVEFCNGIDPGLLLDPTTGKMWMSFGSYFGHIRVVEMDPKTGKRVDDKYHNIGINLEASIIIYRDGWYYLLGTRGSCCSGADSGYHIRVGRSRSVTGPYVDHTGVDMIQGGGTLFLGSGGRVIGAGHFGLLDLGDGVQKFSQHWEADLDRGGASVLDIRPLLWRDGWPIAGENFKAGTYQIHSVRTGTSLELAVEGVPVGGRRGRGMRGGVGGAAGTRGGARGAAPGGADAAGAPRGARAGGGMFGGTGGVIADQDVAEVSVNWPTGNVGVRMANYMCQAQQKWTVTPVPEAGGYPGSPYFKITIAGTDRTLAVGEDGELVALPAFAGTHEQLWRLDQLADGTWRVMPKFASTANESLVLSAVGSSFATLAKFDPASDKQRWLFKTP